MVAPLTGPLLATSGVLSCARGPVPSRSRPLPGFTALTAAQWPASRPGKGTLPAPGTTGGGDNVPFIGKRAPQGNPVRLATAQGQRPPVTAPAGGVPGS